MNIVYGGAFNPPSLAHYNIIKELKDFYKPDNIILLPVGDSYNRKKLLSFKDRYQMLKLMFKNDVIISDIENKNEDYKGTLDTLDKLSKQYKDLYFVMGADNLIDIKTWINYQELLSKYNFIIIKRDDIDLDSFIDNELMLYKNKFSIINLDYDISSSLIRENLERNKAMLNKEVYQYLIDNELYKEW